MNETNESIDGKKPLFPVPADGKYSVVVFIAAIALITGLTFLIWAINLVTVFALRLSLVLLTIVAYTAVAVIAMKLTGQTDKLKPTKRRLWLQILIGAGIAAVLCFSFGILPILCGSSLIGSHEDMSASRIIFLSIEDIVFVGVGEEIVFRGYVQNQFDIWLKKCKWLAPLLAGLLFGLWHVINGNIFQVLISAVIGSVLGYCKYFIKDCSLLSVAVAHGLYDFSLTLLICFML